MKNTERFCPKGHDTLITGRGTRNRCNACRREKHKEAHPPKLRKKQIFCSNGHNTVICGRTKEGHCNICNREYQKKYREKYKEELAEDHKIWYEGNKERISKQAKENRPEILLRERKYNQEHKEEIKERRRKYAQEHKEQIKEKDKKYREEHKEELRLKRRKRSLEKAFGISIEEYDKMLEEQNNVCAGCLRDAQAFRKALAVDHDHKTGAIRGLLCIGCNVFLGMINDDVKVLQRLTKYLIKYKNNKEN